MCATRQLDTPPKNNFWVFTLVPHCESQCRSTKPASPHQFLFIDMKKYLKNKTRVLDTTRQSNKISVSLGSLESDEIGGKK